MGNVEGSHVLEFEDVLIKICKENKLVHVNTNRQVKRAKQVENLQSQHRNNKNK
jgi:hypothetical protein